VCLEDMFGEVHRVLVAFEAVLAAEPLDHAMELAQVGSVLGARALDHLRAETTRVSQLVLGKRRVERVVR
jgi:hypothetical protein